ncbi:MAG: peptidylprolyl isomerase [Victivallales bacterium]|nr:peptidylprolyl isomerase [Victivallales bacterium]
MRATSASKSEVVPESAPAPKKHLSPIVEIQTTLGNIDVALNDKSASKTVENFLSYVKQGHYNGTVFHRVIKNFMIQGGGFTNKFDRKSTKSPIKNEAANGLSNKRGTIAMARLPLVDSATDQFFINHRDNLFLDHKDNTKRNFGYCVFGKVVKGMDVVDRIANAKTMSKFGFRNLPITPIYIKKIVRKR